MPTTPTYQSYRSMMKRCYSPNRKEYRHYGGRGIIVCDQWRGKFDRFLFDMGEKPEGTWLGRIDNNGPYAPENCQWKTPQQQIRNRRSTLHLTLNGETLTAKEWALWAGIPYNTFVKRLKAGIPLAQALIDHPHLFDPQDAISEQ